MKISYILILPFGDGTQIEGILEDHEILTIPPHHSALFTGSMLPQECPQISLLLGHYPVQYSI